MVFKRCNSCHQLFTGKECPTCAAKRQKKRLNDVHSRKLYGSHKWRKCRAIKSQLSSTQFIYVFELSFTAYVLK